MILILLIYFGFQTLDSETSFPQCPPKGNENGPDSFAFFRPMAKPELVSSIVMIGL